MNYKLIAKLLPFIGGGITLVWGFLANDWSRSWIASAVCCGVLLPICAVLARQEDSKNQGKK